MQEKPRSCVTNRPKLLRQDPHTGKHTCTPDGLRNPENSLTGQGPTLEVLVVEVLLLCTELEDLELLELSASNQLRQI